MKARDERVSLMNEVSLRQLETHDMHIADMRVIDLGRYPNVEVHGMGA